MSRQSVHASGKRIVVLAGESSNDRRMLAALIKANHPALADTVTLTEITDQVRLRKKSGTDLSTAATTLVKKACGKARQKNGLFVGIAVHEDMDASPGPAYDLARRTVSAALAKAAGTNSTAYALAAAESEAWLLLFPDAFPLVHRSWSIPAQLRGKDTGRRRTPNEDLIGALSTPGYRESDGPVILTEALKRGMLTHPEGSNRSYSEFLADLAKWQPAAPQR
ncbi:hypothetical protein [Actinacidiphila yeochonensis]|uniref:hypothetical protein n=1 Tax=Actinacidiphila yeochonensis TaxID=89050 RepID=UPI00068DE16C|nr:hypothetical protein [Actinacidiphila yeochonensis]